jgi:methyl-accepting chemotaxis protein WspA
MFHNLSIKNKLYLGFGAIVVIFLLLLALAYNNFTRVTEANGWDKHTTEVLLAIDKVNLNIMEVQVEARGYYLTGAPDRLAKIQTELTDVGPLIKNLQRLTADNPTQVARLGKLDATLNTWIADVIDTTVAQRQALGNAPNAADTIGQSPQLRSGSPIIKSVYAILAESAADESRLLAQRAETLAQLQRSMVLVLSIGSIICLAIATAIAVLIARALLTPINSLTHAVNRIAAGEQGARAEVHAQDELGKVTVEFNRMAQAIQDSQQQALAVSTLLKAKVDSLLGVVSKAASGDLTGAITVGGEDAIGQLGDGLETMLGNLRKLLNNVQKAGIQVTTSATEIAASAKQQEATGIEQAQTSVEILSTTKEISANTSQLLKTMEEATSVADYTTNATADAQTNLKRMDQTMQHMVTATDSINAKLAALSEKASNINSVLITITKVADQTNILSLNAAIEAEKAGDAGRGFSVVATEIRRLADQTSVSTWDIEQMLKEMQSAVSASVMGMDKFSEEIRRSVGEVRQVGEQLSSVMDQVQKLAPQFDLVLQGMQSQAIGASQISDTMMQLNDATQQTVESLKATSEAVHQLQYAAGDLQSSVATFSVNA